MTRYTALIAGVTGAVGAALARELSGRSEWTVIGLSRAAPSTPIADVEYLQVDLNDPHACVDILRPLTQITHVFYCARATHAEQVLEDAQANLRLLRHVLDAVESVAKDFQHAHLVQGGKYYGVHVGPFPTPARESDSRAPIPNFNYDQQDFLSSRSAQACWTWSASRPNTLVHFSPDIARNLVSSLGVYATLCRELGAALDFPGPEAAYNSLTQVTSLDLLARGIAWMSTHPECANRAFNITNTDVFRWSRVWPQLAQAFSMPLGSIRPMKLEHFMADRQPVWQSVCERNTLRQPDLRYLVNWGYLDATLERTWDEILCHNAVRELGFHDWDNSERRLMSTLQQYHDADLLPA